MDSAAITGFARRRNNQKPSVGGFDRIAANDDRCLVSFSIRARGGLRPSYSKAFRSVTIMNSQGRLSREEGRPFRLVSVCLSFLFYRAIFVPTYAFAIGIVSKVWFSGSCRWFPVIGAGHSRENGGDQKRQILIKRRVLWFYNGLLSLNIGG